MSYHALCFICYEHAITLQYAPFTQETLNQTLSTYNHSYNASKLLPLVNALAKHVMSPMGDDKSLSTLIKRFGSGIFDLYLEPAISFVRTILVENSRTQKTDNEIRKLWLYRIKYGSQNDVYNRINTWSRSFFTPPASVENIQQEQPLQNTDYDFNYIAKKLVHFMSNDMNANAISQAIDQQSLQFNEKEKELISTLSKVLSNIHIRKPTQVKQEPQKWPTEELEMFYNDTELENDTLSGWWSKMGYPTIKVPSWARQTSHDDPGDYIDISVTPVDPYFLMK
jgi:hypothetical protein